MPSTGTTTMYSAVMKPALPTLAYCRAHCCRLLARPRITPHKTPPSHRFFLSAGVEVSRRLPERRPSSGISGSSTAPPNRLRTQLKVKGPT